MARILLGGANYFEPLFKSIFNCLSLRSWYSAYEVHRLVLAQYSLVRLSPGQRSSPHLGHLLGTEAQLPREAGGLLIGLRLRGVSELMRRCVTPMRVGKGAGCV